MLTQQLNSSLNVSYVNKNRLKIGWFFSFSVQYSSETFFFKAYVFEATNALGFRNTNTYKTLTNRIVPTNYAEYFKIID